MNIILKPNLFTAGVFDSTYTFPDVKITPPRAVNCWELEFYSENCGTTYINDEEFRIKKDSVLCARPGDIRHSELPLRAVYLKLHAEGELKNILDVLPPFFSSSETPQIVCEIKSLLDVPEENDLLRYSKFLSVLEKTVAASEKSRRLEQIPVRKSRIGIESGINYMEDHFREKCILKDIAAYAHFSPVYFHGIFKIATGKTPYEYLFDLRIKEAKRLLLTESVSMTEIAERCGFTSQSYFNYSFKKDTGETPSEYKRRMLERYLSEHGRFD